MIVWPPSRRGVSKSVLPHYAQCDPVWNEIRRMSWPCGQEQMNREQSCYATNVTGEKTLDNMGYFWFIQDDPNVVGLSRNNTLVMLTVSINCSNSYKVLYSRKTNVTWRVYSGQSNVVLQLLISVRDMYMQECMLLNTRPMQFQYIQVAGRDYGLQCISLLTAQSKLEMKRQTFNTFITSLGIAQPPYSAWWSFNTNSCGGNLVMEGG